MRLRQKLNRGVGFVWRRYGSVESHLPEVDEQDQRIIKDVAPFTMTSPERLYGLINAVRHVVRNGIQGTIVECGVWRGGSMMATAKTLLLAGVKDRQLVLFDTFEGMTAPTAEDGTRFSGETPQQTFEAMRVSKSTNKWCYASIDDVRANLSSTCYPTDQFRLIKGPVEETLPEHAPHSIALLRLDTDFYASTKHELIHLYPRLVSGGILILDDYGHWEGQRRAVEEYLAEQKIPLLLNRLDYTGRIAVKP